MFRSATSQVILVLGAAGLIAAVTLAISPREKATISSAAPMDFSAQTPLPVVSAAAYSEILIDRPVEGTGKLETEIGQLQKIVNVERQRVGALEQLGWLFVAKARKDGDAGLYLRARACAEAMEATDPGRRMDALLLRGHIHHQLHQFGEAEAIARDLISSRGNPFDYAMLGDALFDRGKIDGAAEAYEKLMELRPGLPAYLRAGEMRWLHGDVEGCLEVMLMAVRAGSTRQPEPLAWALSRLSHFLLLAGRLDESRAASERALDLVPGYTPAMGTKGRVLMAQGEFDAAAPILREAAETVPQPGYQWPYYECLLALQRGPEAELIWKKIVSTGEREDPRTYALLLATLSRDVESALTLARREITIRHDVHTHDTLALALLAAAGAASTERIAEARTEMKKALALGTQEPRLFLHAALISERANDHAAARLFATKADSLRHSLFPSETALLASILDRLATAPAQAVTVVTDRKTPGYGQYDPKPDNQTNK